jgi:hypothetical protein
MAAAMVATRAATTLAIIAIRRPSDRRDASHRAAAHHADEPGGQNWRERTSRHAPIPDDGRNRNAKELIVYAIDADGERRQQDHPLLNGAPSAGVERLADVHASRGL